MPLGIEVEEEGREREGKGGEGDEEGRRGYTSQLIKLQKRR